MATVEDVVDGVETLKVVEAAPAAAAEETKAEAAVSSVVAAAVESKDDNETPKDKQTTARERLLVDATQRTFSALVSVILGNPDVLSVLQNRYNVFTPQVGRFGVWMIVFNTETAIRFQHSINRILKSENMAALLTREADSEKEGEENTSSFFDWRNLVVFVPLETIRQFLETREIFEKARDAENKLTPEALAMQEDFMSRHKLLSIIQVCDLVDIVKCAIMRDPAKQIACTLLAVDPQTRVSVVEPFMFDLQHIFTTPFVFQVTCALHYIIANRDCELNLLFCSGRKRPLDRDEAREIRHINLLYAASILVDNGIVEDVDQADITFMPKSLSAPLARCGHCGKHGATVRCPTCYLFRYCDEECRVKHYNDGIIGAKENAGTDFIVTHAHTCLVAQSWARLWAQFPPGFTRDDYAEVMERASAKFEALNKDPEATKVEIKEVENTSASTVDVK